MIKCFHTSCQGERHKIESAPCEDCSYSMVQNGIAIAIVCDGHGSAEYFRSAIGAKMAAEVTVDAVLNFVKNTDKALLVGQQFSSFGANENDEPLTDEAYMVFRKLFTSVIYLWEKKVNEHALNNPITDEEAKSLPANYKELLTDGMFMDSPYGTTLLAYVQTPRYWFAFQIGDGKIVSFDAESKWQEPVMADKKCHDNITTSLCDFDAINEFRFCYQGDGGFPCSVFLCTDGLEDSFKSVDKLTEFYKNLLMDMAIQPEKIIIRCLNKILPQLSILCSQDDISIS